MKIAITVLLALVLTGCLSTSQPNYYYSNGYGSVDIPIENSRIRINSGGGVHLSTPNGYFSF